MKPSRIKHTITYLLLVLFLSMKITGLHALSHTTDDTVDDVCAICDHAIAHNLTPIIFPSTVDFHIENKVLPIEKKFASNYKTTVINTIVTSKLFCRPPPSLL